MAVPAYTHDLIDWIADSDATAWGELVNAAAGGNPDEVDTESALQGTNTVSQATNATTLCSLCRILTTPVTLASGQVFLVWHGHGVATALANYASGGLRLAVATTLTDWKAWAVGGVDVPPYPYGRWINNPIDPTITAEYTNGTPPTGATNIYGVGSMCILTLSVARGQPHAVDMIRYGRAQARFTGGQASNYCVFSGYAALNDAQTARWGLIQKTDGGYLWKGLMLIGLSTVATTQRARTSNVATLTVASGHGLQVGDTVVITGLGGTGYNVTAALTARTATSISYANTGTNEGTTADTGGLINGVADFRDSNANIFIQDTRKVLSTFNKIEIRNASTRVDWTGINFAGLSPSTTASKGDFAMIDAADLNIDSCTFVDMNTFVFLSSASIVGSTFRRCGNITSGGAIFSGSTIINSTAAISVTTSSYTDIEDFTGCSFISDGSNHAMDLGTVSATASVSWANYLTGYAGTNGSTGNEALKVNVASGQTLTISVTSGYDTPSVYNTGSGTVTVVSGTVTVAVTTKDVAGAVVGSANVFLKAASGGSGILPVSATVNTITRVNATTAEATHAAVHNMSTGDKVYIQGANQQAYNGVFTVTVTSTTVYRYTLASDPGVNATGTLTATFVFLKDTTNAGTGVLSMSRVITADQNVTGWARKSSTPPNYTPPNYKTSIISGTALSASGFSATVLLISDD